MPDGVKRRILLRTAAIIAVAASAGLVVDATVAGLNQAAAVAGVVAAICGFAALLLGVAGWAGERQRAEAGNEVSAANQPGDSVQATGDTRISAERPAAKFIVDVHSADGVQVGDGNTQHNDFRRS